MSDMPKKQRRGRKATRKLQLEFRERTPRRKMAKTFDEEFAQLALAHALGRIERNPAVMTEIRGNLESRVHFERALALDAHPERNRKAFAVVVKQRESAFSHA